MNSPEKTRSDKILQLGRIAVGKLKRNSTNDIQAQAHNLVTSFLLSQQSIGYIGDISLVYDGMDIVSISGGNKKEKNATIASLAQISNYVRTVLDGEKEEEIEVLIQQIRSLNYNENVLITLAERDPLTDLINRKTLDTQIETRIDGTQDVVFMMFDLVRFKYINDIHGHSAGDNTLILFAEVCKEFYNNPENGSAIIARTGGDEFIGIFIGKTIEEGRILAYKFRELLALRYRENTTDVIPVETSIGVSSLYDGIGMPIEVEQKDSNKVQTTVEKLVSMALKKADILAHVAKNNSDNIATTFTMDLLNTAELSEENTQLGAELSGILRHWISDEGIPDHIRKIRKILLPFLSVHNSIDEIASLMTHITTIFQKNSKNIPHKLGETVHNELESLRNHWIQGTIK